MFVVKVSCMDQRGWGGGGIIVRSVQWSKNIERKIQLLNIIYCQFAICLPSNLRSMPMYPPLVEAVKEATSRESPGAPGMFISCVYCVKPEKNTNSDSIHELHQHTLTTFADGLTNVSTSCISAYAPVLVGSPSI